MSDAAAPHGFQYSSARHQIDTARAGMWLFLATETLFFGALGLCWVVARHMEMAGFDQGARLTNLAVGTINTAILLTSSLLYSVGLAFREAGQIRRSIQCCLLVMLCGIAFLALKFGIEWREDFHRHLFPGADFALAGPLRGGAEMFYVFYFVATALHGLHLLVGLALIGWIIHRSRHGTVSSTAVELVGLYWSFVDLVWIVLYPLIYLIGRGA